MEKELDLKNPAYYDNRELSWLKFEHRILNEARDKSIPLLERMKFLSIVSSNLDEFFMVRVASLKDMVHAKYKKKDMAGMTAMQQLDAIRNGEFLLFSISVSVNTLHSINFSQYAFGITHKLLTLGSQDHSLRTSLKNSNSEVCLKLLDRAAYIRLCRHE